MVPIYAVVSTLSFYFYREALYYQVIRDCYEAVVVTSFFYLLLQYLGDTSAEQSAALKGFRMKGWMWPLGCIRAKPKDGPSFVWVMKLSILQYAIVRPVCTLATVGMQYYGVYCLASWMPWFGHVWMALIISTSVSVALYALLQFYWELRKELAPYSPILKFLAIKTTVFLTFWQDTFLSLLVGFDVIKPSQYWSAEHIQVGINALLCTFEMVLFGFLHVKAFTYLVYRPRDKKRTTSRGRALLHVLDFRDWFYEMKDTTNYYVAKASGRNFSHVEEVRAQKYRHLEQALGRSRDEELKLQLLREKETLPPFWKNGLDHQEEQEQESQTLEKESSAVDLEKRGENAHSSANWRLWGRRSTPNASASAKSRQAETPLSKLRELEKAEPGEEDEGLLAFAARLERADRANAQHPELTLLHRPPVFDGELGPADVADPQFQDDWKTHMLWQNFYDENGKHMPRPSEIDEGHGKQTSWWQALRDRMSDSWAGQPPPKPRQEDGEADETKPMIEDATTESRAIPSTPPHNAGTFGSNESPLGRIIGGTIDGQKVKSPEAAPQFLPLPASRPMQGSYVQVFSGAAPDMSRSQTAHSASSFGGHPGQDSLTAHVGSVDRIAVLRQTSVAESSKVASLSTHRERGDQAHERVDVPFTNTGQASGNGSTAFGPKGMKINLIMPDALSPARFPGNCSPIASPPLSSRHLPAVEARPARSSAGYYHVSIEGNDRYACHDGAGAPGEVEVRASSLLSLVPGEDAFGAVNQGLTFQPSRPIPDRGRDQQQERRREASGPKHPHLSPVQAPGGSAFAVGSIVSPLAIAHATAPLPMLGRPVRSGPPTQHQTRIASAPSASRRLSQTPHQRSHGPRTAMPASNEIGYLLHDSASHSFSVSAWNTESRGGREAPPSADTANTFGIIEYID